MILKSYLPYFFLILFLTFLAPACGHREEDAAQIQTKERKRNIFDYAKLSREELILEREKSRVQGISDDLWDYKHDTGSFPTQEQGLKALVEKPILGPAPSNWGGPYMLYLESLIDSWGNPYEYRKPGVYRPDSFDLYSKGPDGVGDGTGPDDLNNFEKRIETRQVTNPKTGVLESEYTSVDGQVMGPRKAFYPSGQLRTVIEGEGPGKITHFQEYYESGALKMEANNLQGPAGVTRDYYEDGQLAAEATYANGVLSGSTGYYENGSVEEKTSYQNGKITLVERYGENGLLMSKLFYESGKKSKLEKYDSEGNVVESRPYNTG